ncbi:hypothetical protein H310_09773 [Aphanomyces invadans]|uniref:J domain-containing protein n=1 Tax=Aphanomyces invadans TaxID=157072 RepID=A0A024TSD1_9STRA|nr:hypothetical protein H310_09773 [Aphanomyces invadans]ETV96908.1 hypothetical protein H310_09773 [Aphanomyces invadans]|eukprot:XP_008874154.1 hypothetical protein H310_09773 [Aphanomyces invadans]
MNAGGGKVRYGDVDVSALGGGAARRKHRNSVFSSSDEDESVERSSSMLHRTTGSLDADSGGNRRGLFDAAHEDEQDLEMKIKERQMKKKAHWDTLQAKLHEAMQAVDAHKNDVEVLTMQLAAALAKVDKRNRQLHNAKSLVHSLQSDLALLQAQLEEESTARRRDREAWEGERTVLLREIQSLKAAKASAAPQLSPTTLLGKVWSRKAPTKDTFATSPPVVPVVTTQRPAMFAVPVIPSDEEESSDSILGHSSDSQDDLSENDVSVDERDAPVPLFEEEDVPANIPIGVSRMNFYMEARMKKEAEKRDKELQEKLEKSKLQEEFDNEWAALARETQELKRAKKLKKPTKGNTRMTRQRPASFKQVPVASQPPAATPPPPPTTAPTGVPVQKTRASSATDSADPPVNTIPPQLSRATIPPVTTSPPLPPEPSEADMELYRRQQARLHELHETERVKREKAEEADALRRHLHASVAQWAVGKPLLGLLNSLDQIPELQGIVDCAAIVATNDPDSIKKGYRALIRVIHPDKLRNASIPQQLVANEVFTVVTQAFDGFKQWTT